jgi:hypothetical protein
MYAALWPGVGLDAWIHFLFEPEVMRRCWLALGDPHRPGD